MLSPLLIRGHGDEGQLIAKYPVTIALRPGGLLLEHGREQGLPLPGLADGHQGEDPLDE